VILLRLTKDNLAREEVAVIIIAENLLPVPTQIHKEIGQHLKDLLRLLNNQLKPGVSQKQTQDHVSRRMLHPVENPQKQMAMVGKRNLE
jgi:hypothetical protein